MNNLQTGIASILVIALLAALPGVYFYTEGTGQQPASNAGTSSFTENSSDRPQLADYEPVPEPSALPETDFELHTLSEGEKRQIAKKMMIDVNEAPRSQLERISGVGPSTSKSIIEYREENGPFQSVEELDKISGIGPATVEDLRSEIKISGRLPGGADLSLGQEESGGSEEETEESSYSGPSINVNQASSSELQTLDGVGPATAESIIKFRDENGPITNLEQMDKIDGIGSATLENFRGKVSF
jgi:competence protein ComEA